MAWTNPPLIRCLNPFHLMRLNPDNSRDLKFLVQYTSLDEIWNWNEIIINDVSFIWYRHKWKATITNRVPLININVELIGQLKESIYDEWDEWNSAIWRLVAQGFSHTPFDWLQHYKRGCSISGIVIRTYMEFSKELTCTDSNSSRPQEHPLDSQEAFTLRIQNYPGGCGIPV